MLFLWTFILCTLWRINLIWFEQFFASNITTVNADFHIVNSLSVRPKYPTTKPAALDLSRAISGPRWTDLRTVEGQCADKLHKWRIASSVKCSCGQPQTMNHLVVELCPVTALSNGALPQLHVHCADDYCRCICICNVLFLAILRNLLILLIVCMHTVSGLLSPCCLK